MKKNEIESEYDLEINRIIKKIKEVKANTVCIQLPDGLKPKATEIADVIERNTKAKVLIWMGSCFGACDTPHLEKVRPKVDLLIQFGHTEWIF